MQPKLIITFEKMGDAAFDTKSTLIVTSVTGNPNFVLPWPAYVPQLTDVTTAQVKYHGVFEQTQHGDRTKIPDRDAARAALTVMLKKLAPYLELIAAGDIGKLESTGYDLRHDIVKSNDDNPLPAPPNFTFTRGDISGTMAASADSLGTGVSYELNVCTGDPAVESNWVDNGTFRHCSNIVTDGFVPGKIYYARLRGVGPSGPGVWAVSPGVMAA